MEDSENVRIVTVERLNHGIVVQFEYGLYAFYSDDLLYATLPFADLLDGNEILW